MAYPLAFIHIGLPKCASTYLQKSWLNDPQYDLIDLNQIMTAAREYTVQGSQPPHYNINIQPTHQGYQIASSEGFSWAFCNEPSKQKRLKYLHQNSAQILGRAQLTDTIIMMIRNPINYLRSLHEQSIKEGGCESFADFIDNQRQLILATMDLPKIMKAYQEYFPKLHIFSADQLKNSPQAFWSQYQQLTQLNPPSAEILKLAETSFSANRTLDSRVYGLAQLNRQLQLQKQTYDNLDTFKQQSPQEHQFLKEKQNHIAHWINRRCAEFCTDEQFEALCANLMTNNSDGKSFQDIRIDAELAGFIENHYLQPLEAFDTIDDQLLTEYRASLAKARR